MTNPREYSRVRRPRQIVKLELWASGRSIRDMDFFVHDAVAEAEKLREALATVAQQVPQDDICTEEFVAFNLTPDLELTIEVHTDAVYSDYELKERGIRTYVPHVMPKLEEMDTEDLRRITAALCGAEFAVQEPPAKSA